MPINSQNDDKLGFGNFLQNLNSNEYQQLMSMLSTHLASSLSIIGMDQQDNNTTSYVAGICSSVTVDPTFSSKDIWIVDSGATNHVCSIAAAFMSMRIIDNSIVTLPNSTHSGKAMW